MSTSTAYAPNTVYTINGYNFYVEDNGADYAIQSIDPSTIQFELLPGDTWSGDSAGVFRDELASTQQIANGVPIDVSYVMNMAPGSVNSASWTVLGQFHQNDYAGAPSLSPPFAIGLDGQSMTVSIGYTAANGSAVNLTLFKDTSDIVAGQNYAMDVRVTFDPTGGSGRLVVTRNGVTIVDYTGPIGYSTQSSVYWKEGIYEASNATTTMTVGYSNLALTTSAPAPSQAFNGVQTWNSYDGAGNLVSTTTNQYDSSGNLLSSLIQYATGAKTVGTYQIQGQPYVSDVANYDATGALVGETKRYANGTVAYQMEVNNGVTTQATYDSLGHLVSVDVIQTDGSSVVRLYGSDGVTITEVETFNTAGQLTQDTVFNADGSQTISQYLITGQPYTSSKVVINAAGVVVSVEDDYANGQIQYQKFIDSAGATESKTYTSAGALQTWMVVNPDGSRNQSVYAGTTGTDPIQTYTAWTATGAVALYETFNSAGALASKTIYNADGTKELDQYLVTGQPYASSVTLYNAAGAVTSLTQYYSGGVTYYQSFIDATGATEAKTYSTAGVLQRWSINYTDGTRRVWTYDSTGALTAVNGYNASGALTYYKTVNSDGSSTVNLYQITGQSYVSETSVYNATGVMVSDIKYASAGGSTKTTYTSSGVLASIDVIQADGSSALNLYGSDGKTVVESEIFDTSNNLTQDTTYNADGSRTISRYHIVGQPYTSSKVVINAAGVTTSITDYYANGQIQYQKFIDAAGATETNTYTSAGALQTWMIVNTDGSRAQSVCAGTTGTDPIQTHTEWNAAGAVTLYETFDSTGALAWKNVYNADGSKEVDHYLITGQAYTSTATLYNSAGAAVSLTQYYSNGATCYLWFIDAAGATETKNYTSAGVIQRWSVTNQDGSHQVTTYDSTGAVATINSYNASGALTYNKTVNSDGSYQTYQYLIAGQPYVSEASAYNSSGVLVADTKYVSGGAPYSSYSLSSTDVQTTSSYANGVLQETVQVTSTGATTDQLYAANLIATAIAGSETLVSYHNDRFVFGANIGVDVIKGFNAGATANQDIIDLSTLLAPDYAHLQMAQSGSDTVISFGAGQSITLAGVSVSALAPANFAFH